MVRYDRPGRNLRLVFIYGCVYTCQKSAIDIGFVKHEEVTRDQLD
jgi:hypothetical protein